MKKHVIFISISLGAIVGALILGLIGKFVLAFISLFVGSVMNLSLSGILEAIVLGTIMGAVGGLLAIGIRKIKILKTTGQGLVIGTTLYMLSLLFTILLTKMEVNFTGLQFLTLVVVLGLYILYGVSFSVLISRIKY